MNAKLSCELLVIKTGYTGRLTYPRYTRSILNEFCQKRNIIPLFIRDSVYGDGKIVPFVMAADGKSIDYDAVSTSDQLDECIRISERLSENNLSDDGIVVFQVKSANQAADILESIDDLDYCRVHDITAIKFLHNKEGVIDLDYVEMGTSSS